MIHELLCTGAENAVPGRLLADMAGIDDLRTLTHLIEQERRDGIPICASSDSQNPGYYIPENADELARYIGSLSRRLHSVSETLRSCEDAYLKMIGQLRIDES